jgi:predicted ATPase
LALSLTYAAVLHLLGRAEAAAEELLDELRSLSVEHRFPVWLASANIMLGYVLAARGNTTEGLALARQGMTDRAATGLRYHETYYLGLLAQSYERAGQTDEALALITKALETADRTGERWFEAELHRHRGEWLVACGHANEAEIEACFHRALAVTQGQRAKTWELSAATNLARLWYKQGKCTESCDLLAPIYGWFTEGFDMPDLKEAKALLDELRE